MPATLLDAILAHSRQRAAKLHASRASLEAACAVAAPIPDFATALRRSTVAVIAEVKRRSPSLGPIDESVDPVRLAAEYVNGGSAAISVLTEPSRFGGSLEDLRRVSGSVDLPVLRKDFIVDLVQLLEARASGAAAVLLIVRAMTPRELGRLHAEALGIGLGVLVEAHTADEIRIALDAGAGVVGVNARDLDTLQIDCAGAWRMIETIPSDVIAVAESGMGSAADVAAAASAGADAVLIGSALVGAGNAEASVRVMAGIVRRAR
ncbi:MAG: indole-3-glycerol phosphate synthase TrpC [Gemmatimonadales bacterium]